MVLMAFFFLPWSCGKGTWVDILLVHRTLCKSVYVMSQSYPARKFIARKFIARKFIATTKLIKITLYVGVYQVIVFIMARNAVYEINVSSRKKVSIDRLHDLRS